jgi:hypothetical protein
MDRGIPTESSCKCALYWGGATVLLRPPEVDPARADRSRRDGDGRPPPGELPGDATVGGARSHGSGSSSPGSESRLRSGARSRQRRRGVARAPRGRPGGSPPASRAGTPWLNSAHQFARRVSAPSRKCTEVSRQQRVGALDVTHRLCEDRCLIASHRGSEHTGEGTMTKNAAVSSVTWARAASASSALHRYLIENQLLDGVLVGPDSGVRINYRIGRFIKSYTRRLPWRDKRQHRERSAGR